MRPESISLEMYALIRDVNEIHYIFHLSWKYELFVAMLRNFESALLRYCSLKLDKGLFSLSKKDGLDKWS